MKKCKTCNKEFKPRFRTTERHCSPDCFYKDSPNKVKQKSLKQIERERQYKIVRAEFMDELSKKSGNMGIPKCEVCNLAYVSDVHHKQGRLGGMLTNKQFFLGCCRACHQKIEENPEWAYQMGYSHHRINLKKD